MEARKKIQNSQGWWWFFILIYLPLALKVTDTAFRQFSLENIFLKVVVLGTSKHWAYHTSLLIFCLEFRLSSVCRYLNYYYNII